MRKLLSLLLVFLSTQAAIQRKRAQRQLYLDDVNTSTGSIYLQQLSNTNSNMNDMLGHTKRTQELKRVGQWFQDVEDKLDDYRDNVARKLNELHMALQRPKIPMPSLMGGASAMSARSDFGARNSLSKAGSEFGASAGSENEPPK